MYVDMHAQTWPRSPGINVATRKSWSCCLSWCSFAECGSKSTLISGGAGGCAQGPVHCRWRYACLCIACGSHVCCRTARASLHLLKRSVGLRCDADPFLGLWACMLFAFLHCVPCMYIYIYNYMGTALRGAWWFSGRLRALPNVTAHAASMFDVRCVNSQEQKHIRKQIDL